MCLEDVMETGPGYCIMAHLERLVEVHEFRSVVIINLFGRYLVLLSVRGPVIMALWVSRNRMWLVLLNPFTILCPAL